MMISYLSCLLAFCVLSGARAADPAPKVNVSIYYESLCKDSKMFIVKQFYPVYSEGSFRNYITPEFIPTGHSNETHCQHGPRECEGNKLQACALLKLSDDATKAAYVNCIMGLNVTSDATAWPLDQCKNEAGKSYDDIIKCYNGTEGAEKVKEYIKKTDTDLGSSFGVPYIIFNGNKSENVSREASANFRSALCNNLKSLNLKECSNSASTFAATVFPAVLLFILGRL